MLAMLDLKKQAIDLRKRGYSYSKILKEIDVSKSTLSLWLRDINLRVELTQKLLNNQKDNWMFGARARHNQKLQKVADIKTQAIFEIGNISKNNLFLMGVMLYWGEGSKEREGGKSQVVEFTNSDPRMCKLFL